MKKTGDIDYEKLAAFRHALRRFLKFSEEAAQGVGLTPQQHQALLAIKGFPGRDRITNGELAEMLQIKHHSTVGLVNRLVSQDLIVRFPGENDKREVFIALTERGASLLEQLSTVHQTELKQVGPHLSEILEGFNRGPSD